MASKAKKAAPAKAAPAPKKSSAGRARKPPKAPAPPKLSVEDRVRKLEEWALQSGAHLPHAAGEVDASSTK